MTAIPQQPVQTIQPPTVALTVVITLFFGIFGLIPAATSSSKATQLGFPGGKYWTAFFVVFVLQIVLVVSIIAAG